MLPVLLICAHIHFQQTDTQFNEAERQKYEKEFEEYYAQLEKDKKE